MNDNTDCCKLISLRGATVLFPLIGGMRDVLFKHEVLTSLCEAFDSILESTLERLKQDKELKH